MKKTIILSLSALAVSVSQAAYMVKVNLGEEVTFFQWAAEQPVLGPWVNSGLVYDCSNWSPDPSTITVNMPFTQTATDCKQNQEQTAQDREIDTVSGTVRDSGDPYVNTQYITVGNTRTAVGLLESWVAALPDFTSWVDNGALNSCSNWSPAPSTVPANQGFTQTATDCKQPQTRSRQEREQETTTNAIRNTGTAIIENQTITVSSTRAATGTKPVLNCQFDGSTYYWAFSSGSWAMWGELVLFGGTNAQTSVVFNGVTYTRGALQYINGGTDYYYAICK